MIEFQKQQKKCHKDELTIEIDRHVYSEDYINLTKDFCNNKDIKKNINPELFDTSSVDGFFTSLTKLFTFESKIEDFSRIYNRENLLKEYKNGNSSFKTKGLFG